MGASARIELTRALVLSEAVVDANGPELSLKDLRPLVHHAKSCEPSTGVAGGPARITPVGGPTDEPGTLTYEYRLPANHARPFDAKSLELAWDFATDPGKDREVAVCLYAWHGKQSGQYVAQEYLSTAQGSKRLSQDHLANFVDPESGLVRIQIQSRLSELLVRKVTLSATGTRAPRTSAPR